MTEAEPKLRAAQCFARPCRKQVRSTSEGKVSSSRAPCFHLNTASHACMRELHTPIHTHTHLPTKRERESQTHVSDACMNTLSTGVPGAGLFSGQSDIYRHEMEKRGGGGGRGEGWVGAVMIPVVLTN